VFPPRKFYTEQTFILLRTKRIQPRNHAEHTNSEAFPALIGLCALEVRENEIALRNCVVLLRNCTP